MADYRASTTTRNSLVKDVVNITYTGGRKQSEILNEVPKEAVSASEPEVPASCTPEQVITYFEEVIKGTSDKQKKHVYTQAIRWIKELEKKKAEGVAEKITEIVENRAKSDDDALDSVVAE